VKVAHLVIGGEVAGGQVVCRKIIEALLGRGDEALVVSPTPGAFTYQMEALGVPVHLMSFGRSFDLRGALRMGRFLAREHVDLLHTHVLIAMHIQARLGAKMAGVPSISHLHIGNPFNQNRVIRAYQRLLDNRSARWCADLIAVSEATKKEYIQQGISCNRIGVIYNGIDIDQIRPNRSRESVLDGFGLSRDAQLVGLVGRLCPAKGQETLIKAIPEIMRSQKDAYFIFVGKDLESNGPYQEKLEQLAHDLGVQHRIIFTGYRSDVADLVNAFDVMVLPSKVEGLPLVLLEAMALRKAIVASDVGGVSELIRSNETGFLLNSEDVQGFANAIVQFLEQPVLRNEFGARSRDRVASHFSQQAMVEQIFERYDEINPWRSKTKGVMQS
jgi:L-malate glycosyltransferase